MNLAVRLAARSLLRGAVVVNATEAVFGLAASIGDPEACARVATLKGRPPGKGFIVVAAGTAQLGDLVDLDIPLRAAIDADWPGPHTWVLDALDTAPEWLTDDAGRLAVRVTAHPQFALLCTAAGPVVSTSANPAGRPPAKTLLAARRYFGEAVGHYLPGRLGGSDRPTTIRDGRTGAVLRG